jgi:hypothetical protein
LYGAEAIAALSETAPPAERMLAGGGRTVEALNDSDLRHVGRVQALFSGTDFELDFLSFCECLEPVHLDRREVYEYIFAAFLLNEAVAFGVIEPLHLPSGHASCLLLGDASPATPWCGLLR